MSETHVYLATGAGVDRSLYHTDADCRALDRANDARCVDPNAINDRRPCKVCGETPTADRSTCRKCGAEKTADGTCPFCAACEEIGVTNGRHRWDRRKRRSNP